MSRAEEYERRYPDTGLSDAQKQERMERLTFREERQALRRTSRTRGIVVPELPWQKEASDAPGA